MHIHSIEKEKNVFKLKITAGKFAGLSIMTPYMKKKTQTSVIVVSLI